MPGHFSLREALGKHLHSLAPPLLQLLKIPAGLRPQVSFVNFHRHFHSSWNAKIIFFADFVGDFLIEPKRLRFFEGIETVR